MSTEENIVEICSAYAVQSAKNAGNALQSATNAASSAENAGASALQAKQAKEVVEGLAGGVASNAETATQKAEEAKTSETNADTSAKAANESASQAQGFADEAKASVVDTLKRKYWAEGLLYSENYNASVAELKLDVAKAKDLFNATPYDYFALWGEHKMWVLHMGSYGMSYIVILNNAMMEILHTIKLGIYCDLSFCPANMCLTNTHAWFYGDKTIYQYEFATKTLQSRSGIEPTTDMLIGGAMLVPLSNGDVLLGAKYIISKDNLSISGEAVLEDGVTRNITYKYGNCRSYAYTSKTEMQSSISLPIYFLFISGMPPLWVDDRWTFDDNSNRVVTLRTIKTDDGSDIGVGDVFSVVCADGVNWLVKGKSATVRRLTIDINQGAEEIVQSLKANCMTLDKKVPSRYSTVSPVLPDADVEAKDAPTVLFKSSAMTVGYFGLSRAQVNLTLKTPYEYAFALPSAKKLCERISSGLFPCGTTSIFPLFGSSRYYNSMIIYGGQYGNAN